MEEKNQKMIMFLLKQVILSHGYNVAKSKFKYFD